jgi:Asp-tRNA(Asn)/Glu-tRNA(Gln) amidotransferase B subunit
MTMRWQAADAAGFPQGPAVRKSLKIRRERMVRALSGFEIMATQNFSASGTNSSDKLFNALLGQADKNGAGKLSQQTLREILKDVAEGKLSVSQAIQLIQAGGKSGAQGDVSFPDADDLVQGILQGVADGKISAQTAAQLIDAMTQGGGTQIASVGAGNSQPGQFLLQLFQDVAGGDINAQTAAQLIGALGPDDGAPVAGYGVGNNRSGQFLLGLLHEVAIGKISADQAFELVDAVQPVDQTPE